MQSGKQLVEVKSLLAFYGGRPLQSRRVWVMKKRNATGRQETVCADEDEGQVIKEGGGGHEELQRASTISKGLKPHWYYP